MSAAATATLLTQHIVTLARLHGVQVEWRDRAIGRAWRRSKRVRLGRLTPRTAEVRYATALHELGHVLGPQPGARLDREAAAWEWARLAALAWTPRMTAREQYCLRSYHAWALARQHRRRGRPVLPASDAAFWRLLGAC